MSMAVWLGVLACGSLQLAALASDKTQISAETLAILIPGSGEYARAMPDLKPAAKPFFDQGLRFAWAFYFPESIASYQEASRLDPTHPMPYWGLAHAAGPNPNSRYAGMPDDPNGMGKAAIAKAVTYIARASEVEKALIGALQIFYDDAAIPEPEARDRAYLAAMRTLNQQYPEDPDVAALYAASYMSIRRWDYWDSSGEPKDETLQVARSLEKIIEVDQTHPGVLHLHIHLIEASRRPERAMVSANALEATVPIGGHVVHMPAHIFIRVGDYDRAIANNRRSLAVDKEFAAIWGNRPLPNQGTYNLSHRVHAGHALDFIRFAATMQGNYATAATSAWEMANRLSPEAATMGRAQKRRAAPWLVLKIFGRWDELLAMDPPEKTTPYLSGIWSYVKGSALVATGELELAKAELKKLETLASAPDVGGNRAGATATTEIVTLASHGLRGEIQLAMGDLDEAVSSFRAGVAVEDTNNYTEPPDWPQSMRLYLGVALLRAELFEEAQAVFERDLEWNQNNGWALFGLTQALRAQNQKGAADARASQWQTAWENADLELNEAVVLD
ncbi:hypothetical protein N9V92_07405 [Luminiphilus sp.]|nr:hypothetical protein [Luminiphilus sp.]MDB2352999.1 hypothetical protein [Luminiphilus sp.]